MVSFLSFFKAKPSLKKKKKTYDVGFESADRIPAAPASAFAFSRSPVGCSSSRSSWWPRCFASWLCWPPCAEAAESWSFGGKTPEGCRFFFNWFGFRVVCLTSINVIVRYSEFFCFYDFLLLRYLAFSLLKLADGSGKKRGLGLRP